MKRILIGVGIVIWVSTLIIAVLSSLYLFIKRGKNRYENYKTFKRWFSFISWGFSVGFICVVVGTFC